jgi:hypothetical protein
MISSGKSDFSVVLLYYIYVLPSRFHHQHMHLYGLAFYYMLHFTIFVINSNSLFLAATQLPAESFNCRLSILKRLG